MNPHIIYCDRHGDLFDDRCLCPGAIAEEGGFLARLADATAECPSMEAAS